MRPEVSPACPSCGSDRVAWVFYGLPVSLDRLKPDLDTGRIILGSSCCFEDSPQWLCQECNHGWGRPEDLDEMDRLRREAEASSKSWGPRIQGWVGLNLDDEKTLLNGLARRLVFATAGVITVLVVVSVAPPWVGLAILVLWFIPLLWHIVLRFLAVLVGAAFVAFGIGMRRLNWQIAAGAGQVVVLFGLAMLEFTILILAFSYLGGWLLSETVSN